MRTATVEDAGAVKYRRNTASLDEYRTQLVELAAVCPLAVIDGFNVQEVVDFVIKDFAREFFVVGKICFYFFFPLVFKLVEHLFSRAREKMRREFRGEIFFPKVSEYRRDNMFFCCSF